MIREEIKESKWGNKLVYSRRDKIGEGFGKRRVGDKILIVIKYLYEEEEIFNRKYKIKVGEIKEEGIIIRVVRRINEGYYDYWYKVKLNNGKNIWRSYVELIE